MISFALLRKCLYYAYTTPVVTQQTLSKRPSWQVEDWIELNYNLTTLIRILKSYSSKSYFSTYEVSDFFKLIFFFHRESKFQVLGYFPYPKRNLRLETTNLYLLRGLYSTYLRSLPKPMGFNFRNIMSQVRSLFL